MQEPNPVKLAILIDAENVLPSFAETMFTQANSMGEIVCKEIYGVAAALNTWVEPVLKYAIHPNLTIRASKGKNTSDIALVIGAMDVLLRNEVNTVIIASSDSDFSGLSVRLRTAGINVIGMGTDKSNPLWRTACSSFVVLEPPQPQRVQNKPQPKPQPAPRPQPKPSQAAAQAERNLQSSHRDRVEAIGKFILNRLASNGGRISTSSLFTMLGKLPEYQVDRHGWGKRPQNYLKSTYADILDFETAADGIVWVSAKGLSPVEASEAEPVSIPADEALEALVEESGDVAAELTEAVEAAPEAIEAAPEAIEEAPQVIEEAAEASEDLPEAAESPEPEAVDPVEVEAPAEPDEVIANFKEQMVQGGIDRETVEQIAAILSQTDSMRVAYNTLRRTFGNEAGRSYYNRVKAVLGIK